MHEVICASMVLLIVLEMVVLIGLCYRESKVFNLVIYYTWITEEDDKADEVAKGDEGSYASTIILVAIHLVVYIGLLVAAVLTDPRLPKPWLV
jgi:heme A synthase